MSQDVRIAVLDPIPRRRHPTAPLPPDAKYRRVARDLVRTPAIDGMPETPYLVARVAFTAVAEALGITRPALYRLWPSQYDFWVDLARYIAYEIDYSQPDHDMPWNARYTVVEPTTERFADDEIDGLLSASANAVQDALFANVQILIRAASLGYPDIGDLGHIRRQVETRRIDQFRADVDSSLVVLGRTPGPHGTFDVAASLWCIADGLSVLHPFLGDECGRRAEVDFGRGPQTWTMLSLTVRALYLGLSAPRAARDDVPELRAPFVVPVPEHVWSAGQIAALDVATELFADSITDPQPQIEQDEVSVLGYVTIARVAALAGVSRRTIYNVWPTREAMMADILEDLLADGRADQRRVLHAENGGELGAMTNDLVGPAGTAPPIDPALAFVIELGDEPHCAAIAASQRALAGDFTARMRLHMASLHRRPRDGITIDDLGLLWMCLVQGGRRLRRVSPETAVAFDVVAETLVHELTIDD